MGITKEDLQNIYSRTEAQYEYYGREIFFNFTQVQRVNTRWIDIKKIDDKGIYFIFYGYAQTRVSHRISWQDWTETLRQNHVRRLQEKNYES